MLSPRGLPGLVSEHPPEKLTLHPSFIQLSVGAAISRENGNVYRNEQQLFKAWFSEHTPNLRRCLSEPPAKRQGRHGG